MRGLIAVVLALWLTAGQAAAQSGQGYLMIEANDEAMSAVDMDSIERRGDHAIAWFVMVDPNGETFRYFESRTEYDCVGSRQRQIGQRVYRADHSLALNSDEVDPWAVVQPGSIGDLLLQAACRPETVDADRLMPRDLTRLVDTYLSVLAEPAE